MVRQVPTISKKVDDEDDDGCQQTIITVDKRWKTDENDEKIVDFVAVDVAAAEVAPMVRAVDGAMESLNFCKWKIVRDLDYQINSQPSCF